MTTSLTMNKPAKKKIRRNLAEAEKLAKEAATLVKSDNPQEQELSELYSIVANTHINLAKELREAAKDGIEVYDD
jgi:F0F1-type ATP synthase membrane subunit b/b'